MARTWLAQRLIVWHRTHGRHDLPWSGVRDPYIVWLSEIMLQQTQVTRVIDYFNRFLTHFPDITTLAAASLDDVMPFWSGLGYYARCKYLHQTACIVAAEYGGRFPTDFDTIRTLPGIGVSTAGAICAFAYRQHRPICDGNVQRVLARFFGLHAEIGSGEGMRMFWRYAKDNTPKRGVATYTQAIMDIGATVCTKTAPVCTACPLAKRCYANIHKAISAFPKKRPVRKKPIKRFALYVCMRADNSVWLIQRDGSGFWPHLFCLPMVPQVADTHPDAMHALSPTPMTTIRHQFTHFGLDMRIYRIRTIPQIFSSPADVGRWMGPTHIAEAALPAPIRRLLYTLFPQGAG